MLTLRAARGAASSLACLRGEGVQKFHTYGDTMRRAEVVNLKWRTARYCQHGGCVEVAPMENGSVAVRDSKDGENGAVLQFTADEWHAFIRGAKDGEFDDMIP